MNCKAIQHSDQMVCESCGLTWDMNDPSPPVCRVPLPVVKTVFLFLNRKQPAARATIDVPGLGEVAIESALSDELHARVLAESLAALRQKLGQVLTS